MASPLRPLRWPAVVTAVLALALLAQAAVTPVPAYAVGGTVGGVAAAAAAAVMCRCDLFEARLAAVGVSSVSGLLAGVAMVLGAPGDPRHGPTPGSVLVLACALALPLLLGRRSRRGRAGASGPYPQGP